MRTSPLAVALLLAACSTTEPAAPPPPVAPPRAEPAPMPALMPPPAVTPAPPPRDERVLVPLEYVKVERGPLAGASVLSHMRLEVVGAAGAETIAPASTAAPGRSF